MRGFPMLSWQRDLSWHYIDAAVATADDYLHAPVIYISGIQALPFMRDGAQAAKVGRLFPLSLASEGSCRIGGNLAANAGGTAVLRYGNARDLCLGLEAVLPDGSIFNGLTRLRKDNAGYDLRHLLIGSEGTLGVITAASLKLFPRPAARVVELLAVPSPAAALRGPWPRSVGRGRRRAEQPAQPPASSTNRSS